MLSDSTEFEESDDDLLLNKLIMELLHVFKHELAKPSPTYYYLQRDAMEGFLKDEFPTVSKQNFG